MFADLKVLPGRSNIFNDNATTPESGRRIMTMRKCQLEIQATPEMHDARELKTILNASLNALFGDFDGEYHGCQAVVTKSKGQTPSMFLVECPQESMAAVRAAFSMVTTPPYLLGTVYRFDIINITSFK